MLQGLPSALRDWLVNDSSRRDRHFWALDASVALADLANGSSLHSDLRELEGRSVLVATSEQLTTGLALIELDGVARRLTLLPPDMRSEYLPAVVANAEIDVIVTDREAQDYGTLGVSRVVTCSSVIAPITNVGLTRRKTEWVLFTSGTTGMPKMVVHTLDGLTAAIKRREIPDPSIIWGTYYDIRRYGGLQIFFRAILDGGSLILSNAHEAAADYLVRLGKLGVTHMTGTPSHWRRTLMTPNANAISPQYCRLSGEIADQAILDALHASYPQARIGHAYASTEAGVGFDVNDMLAGFPANMIGRNGLDGDVQMKIVDGSLRIRSKGAAVRYLGDESAPLVDGEGYIDTGDILEQRGGRYYFVGRKGGIINVGGLKVHPEEVEAIINRHPDVRMSLVYPRKNPITGTVVAADVVLKENFDMAGTDPRVVTLRRDILLYCREKMAQHKVPVTIRFVPTLTMNATGKLVRQNA
jgi:acyl-coenzyme A synthetase/AMP-(fatty) acid ligase